MVNIIADLHMADNVARQYSMSERDSIQNLLRQSLLKLHNVTESQLDTNLYLYQTDLENYRRVSKRVLDRLKEMEKNQVEQDKTNNTE